MNAQSNRALSDSISISFASDVLALVRDESFARLWKLSCTEGLPWSSFRELDPPACCTIEEAYALIAALRHRAASVIPFDNYMPEVADSDCWYFETTGIHRSLCSIVSLAKAGSELDVLMKRYVPMRQRPLLLAEELSSLAARDGIQIDLGRVRDIVSRIVGPEGPEDLLIARAAELLADAMRFKGRRISAGLIELLYSELTAGITLDSASLARRHLVEHKKPSVLSDPDVAVAKVVELANAKGLCAQMNPIIRSVLISGIFWDFDPYPVANSLLELIVRVIFYQNEGLPVLGWVPYSDAFDRWQRGEIAPPQVSCRCLEKNPDCGEGYDSTDYFSNEFKLIRIELERLGRRLNSLAEADEENRKILGAANRLNERQREVLLLSLRNPGSLVTVEDYRATYGVSYGTARQDLVDLVGMKLMHKTKRGHAYLYEATPLLRDYMAKRRE